MIITQLPHHARIQYKKSFSDHISVIRVYSQCIGAMYRSEKEYQDRAALFMSSIVGKGQWGNNECGVAAK